MQKIKLPYHIIELNINNSENIVTLPLLDTQVLRVNVPHYMLAGKFANSYQQKRLDKGRYKSILNHYTKGDYEQHNISVEFKATKKNIAFKKMVLRFDYFLQEHPQGYWSSVPVLGIESFAPTEELIEENLREAIRLEFIRNQRLNLLQDIIPTIWYQEPILKTEILDFICHTPSELETLKEEQQKQVLPRVAEKLYIDKKVMYGNHKEIKQLTEILNGRFNKNVLIVGKSGVGKSTLVWELVNQRSKLNIKQQIWETTASTLIKELTGDMGWQENLAILCKELTHKGDTLFIRNLLELFEVGQYEGNSVSVAGYLREYIARGEVSIISECTQEEFARIEARSPNYLSLFQTIQLEEPLDDLEDIILQKVRQIALSEKKEIDNEAIRETIRLNRRYTPYSGFPGKPIRFLESVLINNTQPVIDRSEIIKAFCEETGMPPFMVDPAIAMNLEQVSQFFKKNVFGQDHTIHILVDILASVKAALARQGKPIASMLFIGPTGVGKTEMAKVLAEFMFGSREKMIRFDMSEYSTPYAVARLTGESYFSDGLLTSAVRREPFCVLLFDELEKAHPLFNDLLLQMLGEGRLTDSQGKVVNFCSTIIIMTSNIGAQKLTNQSIGWNTERSNQDVANHFENEVRKYFRPEIFNRIDQVLPFYPLHQNVVRFVVERELELFKKREGILHRNIEFHLSEALYEFLCNRGYNQKYGARALQRTLREDLITPLSYYLNQFNFEEQLVVSVDIEDEELLIEIESDPFKLELMLEELTQNEFMDYASELRYKIYKLCEGHFYIRLSSELDIMDRQKKKQEKKFWSKKENAENYSNYLAMKEEIKKQRDIISNYEQEMALISMGLQTLNTNLYDQIKEWDENYFKTKLQLYSLLEPQGDETFIGIYGAQVPKTLLNIYLEICNHQNFKYKIQTVWYREELYNELIEEIIPVDEDDENGPDKPGKIRRLAKKYHHKDFFEKDSKRWKPDEPQDKLVGIELKIKGIGANLYLGNEGGAHHVYISENEAQQYWLISSEQEFQTPEDVHRKTFFKKAKRARRSYKLHNIEDTELKFPKREVEPKNYAPFIIDVLDKIFSKKLDEILI
ncbi:MAG: AAA domain-containing protein [Aureispira sp.]|nr:AAA domain-containing protein [Aureispira sp.]